MHKTTRIGNQIAHVRVQLIGPPLLSSGAVRGAYHRNMELIRRRENTGTFCSNDHPEQIEYRYALVDGVEVPNGRTGPRCWVGGCPDNEAAKAREQLRKPRSE